MWCSERPTTCRLNTEFTGNLQVFRIRLQQVVVFPQAKCPLILYRLTTLRKRNLKF